MKVTKTQIKEALIKNHGIIVKAANALGVTYRAIYNRVQSDTELLNLAKEEREKMLDIAENELFTQIKAGNTTAIIFFLKTWGASRGYSPKLNFTADMKIKKENPFEKLTLEQLQRLAGVDDEKGE